MIFHAIALGNNTLTRITYPAYISNLSINFSSQKIPTLPKSFFTSWIEQVKMCIFHLIILIDFSQNLAACMHHMSADTCSNISATIPKLSQGFTKFNKISNLKTYSLDILAR